MTKLSVINLYCGPGGGKSTTAAAIFSELKQLGINAELVTEYAKDLTWERRHHTLRDQIYIFGKQQKRLNQMVGQVDVVVTDSPILLSTIYNLEWSENFDRLVREVYDKFDNMDFLLKRVKPYQEAGRNQSEDEAKEKDEEILMMLRNHGVGYFATTGDRGGVEFIKRTYLTWKLGLKESKETA